MKRRLVWWWFAVWQCLVFAGCSPPGTLDLEASPKTIRAGKDSALVVVRATSGTGAIGSGPVVVHSSVGAAREGVTVQLDTFGSVRTSVACDPNDDVRCNSLPTMDFTASWVSSGKTVTAEASVKLLPATAVETNCTNGKDDDLDGLVDCDDPDCEGRTCTSADRCLAGSTCSQKQCTGGAPIDCAAAPPIACHAPTGQCDHGAGCIYVVADVGKSCDDQNACTTGDLCDATGACVGTAVSCPKSMDSCHADGVCDPATGACLKPNLKDGTSCGLAASSRCCTGNCVDISYDSTNCGGCGVTCSGACRSVSAICGNPSATSGYCGCGTCPTGTACSTTYGYCLPTSCVGTESRTLSPNCSDVSYCHY